MCVVIFSLAPIWKVLGVFLKVVTWLTFLVLDMVLYLCLLFFPTLMSPFGVFSTSGITWDFAPGVLVFILPISVFGKFPFSWCNYWIFAGLKFNQGFWWMHLLKLFWVWIYDGHPHRLCIGEWIWLVCIPHLDSFLVHLLEFLLVYPLDWHPWKVFWGGLIFWILPIGISMPPCVNILVWLVGFLVLYYVVHKWNTVQHELLHLWRTFLACWNIWEKLYCVWYSFCSCFGYVWIMASVVFHWWSYVTAAFSMCWPWWYIVWHIVNHYSCTWWD